MLPRFIFIFLFIGVGEETGWRGFALPELQKRFSPLTASLIIGVIWAAWHIPLMGVEFRGQIIPALLLGVMSASVLSAWLFNHSEGSLLPLPLFHATVNTVGRATCSPCSVAQILQGCGGSIPSRGWWQPFCRFFFHVE